MRRWIVVLLFISASFFGAHAQVIKISKASTGREAISVSELKTSGQLATLFKSVLQKDLENSGIYTIGKGQYESTRVSGVAIDQGGRLKTEILVSSPKGSFSFHDVSTSVRDARWQAHKLSDEILERVNGVQGMASTRIAFVSKNGRSGGICLCDYDGATCQQLSNEKISPLSPYFDNRGNFIFYTSFDKGYPCVFRVPVKGGTRMPYAKFTGLNTGGAVSPDGKYLAIILSHIGNPELYVLSLSDRKVYRQTYTKQAAEASPCWSPDGQNIAYVSDEQGRSPQVFVINSNSHKSKRISYGCSQAVAPSWGPDGRIAYAAKAGGTFQIVVYDPRTGHSETVTSGAEHEDPSWAPDGRHLICSERQGSRNYSLIIVDTEDKSVVKLNIKPQDCHSPEWSSSLQ